VLSKIQWKNIEGARMRIAAEKIRLQYLKEGAISARSWISERRVVAKKELL